ncbi:MAG: prepilin-type cleavage/methylation domain-containing protein [Pseudomonas sp. PGPPP3]|nr:MAG: prepilin-type cleavage/methylation domain-containing protein [Pseudomonas sp. PGPPP3]
MHFRGFTLIELLVVIVIIGILAAVVGPRFFDRQVFDDRLFFEESLSAVRYAQKLAVASGCSINTQVSNSGYALSYAAGCGGIAANSAVANPSGGAYAAGNSHNVSVSPALNVTFDSLGAASGAANSASFASGTFTLTVNLATGFIETTP